MLQKAIFKYLECVTQSPLQTQFTKSLPLWTWELLQVRGTMWEEPGGSCVLRQQSQEAVPAPAILCGLCLETP